MRELPDLVGWVAPIAEHYLTLHRAHPTHTYDYAARGVYGFPVVEHERRAPKCKMGETWTYFAIPASASLARLTDPERLYVGAQTGDRMFRGDGAGGDNFHHGEMRAGKEGDNLVAYLRSSGPVKVMRVRGDRVEAMIRREAALAALMPLLEQPRTARQHLGWWFEQYVLFSQAGRWRWNSRPADAVVARALGRSK